ncbi:histone-lysine N-methyltransferase ASHR1 isoform X1 [Typha angustifolia]|uniref:histone-lysine N-methyltransferase ASHR1 isoform X1 n=1 Tax=Typha angustifolia TaxID=59011 RepID=UPI003C3029B4
MEKVKSLIPNDLKKAIAESTPENLLRTCSSLLEFLRSLPQFQQVIMELTDPEMALCQKGKEKALDFKIKGNDCFSKGDLHQALGFYSQALRHIPMTSNDMEANLIATLYINRAFSMHKLGLFEECLRDCNRAIALSPSYVKAWYRRGKVNASLHNYRAAVHDLEIALSMEGTSSGKGNIKEELKMLQGKLDSTEGPSISSNDGDDNKLASLAGSHDVVLKCVSTPTKGRGMASPKDIHPASLLHTEEPIAAIVTKSCRETHCHFCFNEVPADTFFCPTCTIPIYCSQRCQELAGGEYLCWSQACSPAEKNHAADFAECFAGAISANYTKDVSTKVNFKHVPEHRHECGGTHWSAVLPSDIVLAGRIMAKCIAKRSSEVSNSAETLDLVHHYDQISPASKLEFHIYAVVLSFCLQQYYRSDHPCSETSVAKLVLLICQIKVNSMAIVHIQSADRVANFKKDQKLSATNIMPISSIEQVRVGQAIYSTGSFFNHSCQPNIHAYFLSRTLLIRSTELVPAWCPLELSYGPQVGQMDLLERQKSLEEQYFFKCQCLSCSKLNLSDLVISAFHCPQSNCLGAVVEMTHHKVFGDDFVQVSRASRVCKLSLPNFTSHKVSNNEDIGKVAIKLLQKSGFTSHINPGYCLNCGSLLEMDSAIAATNNAMSSINRMKDSVFLEEVPQVIMSNALKSLSCLRSVKHPYSKAVAQSEDYIAEAFVRMGDLESAMKHCKASIKILEKLYHTEHIVIGHELIKLATIQLSLGDGTSAVNSVKQVDVIFSLYYGANMTKRFPYIGFLREQAVILASCATSI